MQNNETTMTDEHLQIELLEKIPKNVKGETKER